jgi:dTDP-4-dehydrorhamnose 3,5-epimerase
MKKLIDGVVVKTLKPVCDERGRLMEILRRDDPFFTEFGQAYVTTAYPGVTKAWHYHREQVDHFVVLAGMAKIVLYDGREGSPTKGAINEFFAGVHNPILIRIPPLVHHGMKGVSETEAMILNLPTRPYDHASPDEYRLPPDTAEIPYDWSRKDG